MKLYGPREAINCNSVTFVSTKGPRSLRPGGSGLSLQSICVTFMIYHDLQDAQRQETSQSTAEIELAISLWTQPVHDKNKHFYVFTRVQTKRRYTGVGGSVRV